MTKEKTTERQIPQDILDSVDEIAEADYQAALRYYKEKKEKTVEPKIKFAETGLVRLDIKVPRLVPEKAQLIIRYLRFSLENSAKLNLLNEFVITRAMEYIERTE